MTKQDFLPFKITYTLKLCLSVCLSACLPVCLSACLSTYLPVLSLYIFFPSPRLPFSLYLFIFLSHSSLSVPFSPSLLCLSSFSIVLPVIFTLSLSLSLFLPSSLYSPLSSPSICLPVTFFLSLTSSLPPSQPVSSSYLSPHTHKHTFSLSLSPFLSTPKKSWENVSTSSSLTVFRWTKSKKRTIATLI